MKSLAISWLLPYFTMPLRNKRQATKHYINRGSWYLFHSMHCKTGGATMILPNHWTFFLLKGMIKAKLLQQYILKSLYKGKLIQHVYICGGSFCLWFHFGALQVAACHTETAFSFFFVCKFWKWSNPGVKWRQLCTRQSDNRFVMVIGNRSLIIFGQFGSGPFSKLRFLT